LAISLLIEDSSQAAIIDCEREKRRDAASTLYRTPGSSLQPALLSLKKRRRQYRLDSMDCISIAYSLFWFLLRVLRDLRGASGYPAEFRIVDGTTTMVTKSTKSGLRKACPVRIPLSIRDSSHSRCPASFAVHEKSGVPKHAA